MKPTLWLAACALASGALVTSVWAQASPPDLSGAASRVKTMALAIAADAAWQRAVLAREVQGQRQRADAALLASGNPWAAPPALELSHRDDRWQRGAGRRETEVGLVWPLWLPQQRAAHRAAAQAGSVVAELAQSAGRLRVAGEVREAAWALVAQQAELGQTDALVRSVQALADDVDRRMRAGDLARADSMAARAELLGSMVQQAEAHQRLFAARTRWTVLTGLEEPPIADTSAAEPTAADAGEAHPELQLAAQATELARTRVEQVRASGRDAPELKVSYRHDVPGRAEPVQGSLGIGLRLPFGTDGRNQPLLAAALSELDVAQTNEQRTQERLAAELAAARAALQTVEQLLAAEQGRVGLLRERAELIDKSFRAGESPLPDLLRALGAAAQADFALTRQQVALGLARARIQQAQGLLP